MPTISVLIVTLNEERCIAKCLESVKWAHEVIVFDSGSTDKTVEVCRTYTPHVYEADWPGYGGQLNRALAKSTGDWVLSIDADEEVTESLRREIEERISQPDSEYAGYKIPRLNKVCGQYMRHGAWWPDRHPRLAKKGKATFNAKRVHAGMVIHGGIGLLSQPFLHDTAPSVEILLRKLNRFSTLGAEEQFAKGRRSGLLKPFLHGIWHFCRFYVLRAGFLDGRMGFITAVMGAEERYYKYLKLSLLQRSRQSNGHPSNS